MTPDTHGTIAAPVLALLGLYDLPAVYVPDKDPDDPLMRLWVDSPSASEVDI